MKTSSPILAGEGNKFQHWFKPIHRHNRQVLKALRISVASAETPSTKLQRLELDTDEVAQNLQFERAASGINFAIVISHVEPGSQCEKEGLKVRQRLVKVSSPMQSGSSGEMWSINERPSLRFVTDAIRLNRTGSITLEVTEDVFEDVTPVPEDSDESNLLDNMSDAVQGQTIAEKLAAKYKEDEEVGQRDRMQRERRIQRRRDYMDRESTRDNSKFFIGLSLAFFAPAIGILIYAFQSGMLDRINSSYRPY